MNMCLFSVIVTCALLSLVGCETEATQSLPVTAYYESYCPDSIKFMNQQLYPLMQNTNFSLYIDLRLVPYGKASYTLNDGLYNFTCQHGKKECNGNKVQSCALKYITSRKEQLDFINCVMKEIAPDSNQTYPTRKCGQNIPNVEQVEKCAEGPEGSVLLAQNGDTTSALSPSLKSVPTIVVGSAQQADRVESNINLKSVVCKHLSTLNLLECAGTSGSNHLVSGFISILAAAVLVLFARV